MRLSQICELSPAAEQGVQVSPSSVTLARHNRYPTGACVSPSRGLRWGIVSQKNTRLRALCVGRHRFLAGHLARFFTDLGVDATAAVGLDEALISSHVFDPHVVICEYELLATLSLHAWERDELLSSRPVIAVSLTRHPQEAHLLDVNGIGGFLYLPTLDRHAAMRLITAAGSGSLNGYLPTLPTAAMDSAVETTI